MVMGLLLTGAAVVSGIATYAALTSAPPFGKDPKTVSLLLNIDLIILLVLVSMIALRLVRLWSGRRRGQAGYSLQVRLVFIFGFLAATPAIIMTIFSATFFHYGLQSWFSDKIRNAINQSQGFAEAYMVEHQQVIRADILAMANDLDRSANVLAGDKPELQKFVQTQSFIRNFSETAIVDGAGHVEMTSGLSLSLAFQTIPKYTLEQAAQGDVVMLSSTGDEQIRAMVKLNNYPDSYLFVGRMVDPVVRERLDATVKAVHEYEQLEVDRGALQVKMVMIFVTVALVLLFAAVWFGLVLARQLASPITGLVNAADRVRAGDLTARVATDDAIDEFEVLGNAFNRMTAQIGEQRDELISANRQLDQRRRFTETVLAGVSSGVVGLDREGRITLANTSAAALLQSEMSAMIGQKVTDILPDLEPMLDQPSLKLRPTSQIEILYSPKDGSGRRTLLVRIALELIGDQDMGAVLTFDDITELQSAQRKAAWSDVARRIAHEIKNPLTPIQLSAERLKRKYLKQITEDPETFAQCTDTIIHHVGDIGRMVNEFSSFARMPEAVLQRENLATIIRDMQVFQQQAHPEMSITLHGLLEKNMPLHAEVDAQQVRQAMTNVLQNAIDAIEGAEIQNGKLQITVMDEPAGGVAIVVNDNGPGLPKGVDPARLTEPYVTHREKGTGLGLAIVKKIMDDHKGKIILGVPEWVKTSPGWMELGGATSVLIFPMDHIAKVAV
ncbi:MAG: sensory box protein [Micavibrio sp.]|nr:sensory box protein [Micavibrio sp.]